MRKEKEIHANFAVTLQTTKIVVTVHKCLVKVEKALHVWMEGMNRKCVSTGGNMLHQKALRLHSEKDPLKQMTPSHLLQVRNGYTDLGIDLGWKINQLLERQHLPMKKTAARFRAELKKVIKVWYEP